MDLTNNTVFIPGATSGIGLGIALELSERGNTVIVGGRRTEPLDEITTQPPGIESVVIDTSDAAVTAAASQDVMRQFPSTNVLVTIAGIMLAEDLHSPAFLPTAEATVTTNLLGPLRLIGAFTPFLARQKAAAIVTVSSGLAFVPLPMTATYNAAKAAIHSFTESLRVQLADTTVQVIELVPPGVRTTLMGQQDSEQAMPLQEFLDEVFLLLERDPHASEVLIERVRPLRFAEAQGSYPQILAGMSSH